MTSRKQSAKFGWSKSKEVRLIATAEELKKMNKESQSGKQQKEK